VKKSTRKTSFSCRPETLVEGPYVEAVEAEIPHHHTSKQFQYESHG